MNDFPETPRADAVDEDPVKKPEVDPLRRICMLDASGLALFHSIRGAVTESRKEREPGIVSAEPLPVLDAAAGLR